jgi:hypothetical protein
VAADVEDEVVAQAFDDRSEDADAGFHRLRSDHGLGDGALHRRRQRHTNTSSCGEKLAPIGQSSFWR